MKLLSLLLTFSIFTKGQAQNLIPNGSFEEYTSCPDAYSSNGAEPKDKILLVPPWKSSDTTGHFLSDYFNSCANSDTNSYVGVPNNAEGFQSARTGTGYVGLLLFPSMREFIQVQLDSALVEGEHYYFEMYANLSDRRSVCVDGLGAYFSSTSIYPMPSISNSEEYTPQIQNASNNFLSDTINWMHIADYYTATGGERIITIGNFKSDQETNSITTCHNSYNPNFVSYVYIDDVSLRKVDSIPLSQTTISTKSKNSCRLIYSNPIIESFSVKSDCLFKDLFDLELFDLFGRRILYEKNISVNDIINMAEIDIGIYFIHVNSKENLFVEKILKIK